MMILMVVWIGIPMVVTANGLHIILCILSSLLCIVAMSVIKPLRIKLQYRANDIAYAYS